ncbi:MAG: ABC transporter permease [Phycisphaerales bacterium JB039]
MSVLSRKLFRDLAQWRSALWAVGLVIVIGVSSFVGMFSAHQDLRDAVDEYYDACRMADFWIDLERAPTIEARSVADLPNVREIHTRLQTRAQLLLAGVDEPMTATVLSIDPAASAPINDIVLRRGRLPRADDEAIISAAFADARTLAPGDAIALILEGARRELRIVGVAISSEFAYLMGPGGLLPDPANHSLVWVTRRFAEDAMDMVGACNQVVGLLTPAARQRPEPALQAIERALAPYGVLAATPRRLQASHQVLTDELAQLRATAVILPAIFLLVAALVLNIVLSRSVEQQRTIIGMLKALGYSNRRLALHYISAGAVVGLAGGLVGAFAGAWMARGFMAMYRFYFEIPNLQSTAAPVIWGAGVAVSIVAAALGAARGVRAVVRLRPAQAMRPAGGTEAWAPARVGALARRLPLPWRMALRSMGRRKGKVATGILAAALGASLMFTTFYFMDAMNYLVDFQFRLASRSHYDITLVGTSDDRTVRDIAAMPGVMRAEGLLELPCKLRSGHIERLSSVTGIAPGAMLTVPRTAAGAPVPIPRAGLLMSRRLADILDVGAGETISLTPIRGDPRPRPVLVAGVVDGFLGMATYANRDWLAGAIGEPGAITAVQTVVAPDPAVRSAFRRQLAGLGAVEAVTDYAEVERQLRQLLLDSLWYSVLTLVIMAGALFFGSVLGATLTSISQQRREIATHRALGMRAEEVGRIFLCESIIINGLGALLGLPLGLGLSLWLIEAHSRDAYRLPMVASPRSYALTLILAALFTVLAHTLARRAISRHDWRADLRTRE